jgi:hypothetical protein
MKTHPDIPVEHLSYSSISLWNACPKKWWLRYKYRISEPATPALPFGTAVHRVIQHALVSKDYDLAVGEFGRVFHTAAHEARLLLRQNDARLYVALGYAILQDPMIRQSIESIRVSKPEQIEVKLTFDVPGVGIPVLCFIDIIDDDGKPYDIKTSKWAWSEERAQEEVQPDFYLTALDSIGDTRHGGLFNHFVLEKNGELPVAYFLPSERIGYVERVHKMAQDVWEGILRRDWETHGVVQACSTCKLGAACYTH